MKRTALLLIAALTGCSMRNSSSEIGAELIKIEPGHEQRWTELVHSVAHPPAPFIVNIAYIKSEGISVDDLLSGLAKDYPHTVIFIADSHTFTSADRSCLVIDLLDPSRPRFRALPKTLASIENNLSIANMVTGVFSGFK
jgi:hypothetical protein